jgi:hypothetical protein
MMVRERTHRRPLQDDDAPDPIQSVITDRVRRHWVPAFAGMTAKKNEACWIPAGAEMTAKNA